MLKGMITRFLLGSTLIIISACAKISSPSGGPRDRVPPAVLKSDPVNGARNFVENKIEIIFNEYVVLDNISEKFMVSPPMKKKPSVFTRGKGVIVEYDDKLKDSTTYTFYFQDAIKDLNEGNILDNYQFVLSSGPVIDSLSVTGNLYYSFNLEVPEKTTVLMYRELTDSAVVKHLPEYITRVDQYGYFRIDNVRPGTYRLYGLKETDNSKNYNLPDEEFAFMDSSVVITSEKNYIPAAPVISDTTADKGINKNASGKKDITTVKEGIQKEMPEPVILTGEYRLFQFSGPKKAHYLSKSSRELKYYMLYILSTTPDTMKFEFFIPGADTNAYFTESSRNRDSLKVWISDSSLYSQPQITTMLSYPFTDTLGKTGYKKDTIMMRFTTPKPPRGTAKIKIAPFTFESNILSGTLKPGQTIFFNSKTPFRPPDTSRIKLYELVKDTSQKVQYQMIKDSANSGKYYLKTKLAVGKKYLFIADSAAFGNIYGEYSDSIGIKLSVRDPESYCKITVEIKNFTGNMIIQLLDKTEKLVAENYMENDGKIVFSLLDPGVYRLKAIYDLNGDRKWTTGDFDIKRQPEPVSYYPSEIELKTGWDFIFEDEKAWDISVNNLKDPKLLTKKKVK